jgi:hypothetical protein
VTKCTTCTCTFSGTGNTYDDTYCGTAQECVDYTNGLYAQNCSTFTWSCTTPQ